MGGVEAGMIKYGMAIGSDTAQSAPGDALEYTAAAGGCAFIVGRNGSKTLAAIEDTYSTNNEKGQSEHNEEKKEFHPHIPKKPRYSQSSVYP